VNNNKNKRISVYIVKPSHSFVIQRRLKIWKKKRVFKPCLTSTPKQLLGVSEQMVSQNNKNSINKKLYI